MGKLSTFSEYAKDLKETTWLVQNVLTAGGTSLLAGDPKSGKSQLVRHLIKALISQTEFLGNKVNDVNNIIYLALEETPTELKKYFLNIGLEESCNKLLVGDREWSTEGNNIEELEADIIKHQATLCIIDTFVAFTDLNDLNEYVKVYKPLQALANLARRHSCHIMIVHHKNKSEVQGTRSIMGSQAFFGAVDSALLLSGEGEQKSLFVQPRYSARSELGFVMSPDEIKDVSQKVHGMTCVDALLRKVQENDGFEFRNFDGYSKQSMQNAKNALLREGKITESRSKPGQPKKLYIKQ